MAIQKEKILDNGVVANYWRITREDYDRTHGKLTCFISLFLDAEKTVSVAHAKMFMFDVTEQQMAADRTAEAYALIKATGDPDLTGGEDV